MSAIGAGIPSRGFIQYVKERCPSGWGIGTSGTTHPLVLTTC